MSSQGQEFFSNSFMLHIGFKLTGDEKLNFREITSGNIGSVLMGDTTILQELIPHIANANLTQDKGFI